MTRTTSCAAATNPLKAIRLTDTKRVHRIAYSKLRIPNVPTLSSSRPVLKHERTQHRHWPHAGKQSFITCCQWRGSESRMSMSRQPRQSFSMPSIT
eukprot:6206807-Pleurochrysis_carterae.AAC.3